MAATRLEVARPSCHGSGSVRTPQRTAPMAPRLPGFWQELRSPEFDQLDPEATVAVLPVGAVEQHGPHLPVMVDAALNAATVERALALLPPGAPVLVLPMTAVGKSDEHRDYKGTLT